MLRWIAAVIYDCIILFSIFFAFTAICLVFTHKSIPPHTHWYQAALLGLAVLYVGGSLFYGRQTLGMRAWIYR